MAVRVKDMEREATLPPKDKHKLRRKLRSTKSPFELTKEDRDWLDQQLLTERRSIIGGTDVAPILGVSPWRNVRDVWREKTGRAEPSYPSRKMQTGVQLEPLVGEWYAEEMGVTIRRTPMKRTQKYPFLGAHVDYVVKRTGQAVNRILECKTTSYLDPAQWGTENTDEVPHHYWLQCQHMMHVTNYPVCDLAIVELGSIEKLRIYTIEYQRAHYLEEVRPVLIHFWREYVEKNQEPPDSMLGEGQTDPAVARWPRDNGLARPADAEELKLLQELAEAHRAVESGKRDLEAKKKLLAETVATSMGEHAVLTAPSDPTNRLVTFSKPKPSRKVDVKLLQAQFPDAWEACSELTEGKRTFRPNYDRILDTISAEEK